MSSVYSTHLLKWRYHLNPGTCFKQDHGDRGRHRKCVRVTVEVYGSSSSDCFNFLSENKEKHLQPRMKIRKVLGLSGQKGVK